ncbi:MAG: sulfurtransferase [Sandaracinaceae bacterium]|nr:sulfurtransferase [Sandaracinaceae bacterium]
MSTLIAPERLSTAHRLFDVRMGPGAADAYRAAHLEGAHFVDVEADLSGDASDPSHGGRHPLPELRAFCERLGQLGIAPDTDVVLYDDAGGAKAAARMWWMLRAVGHERVWVLDGGLDAAVAAGWPVSPDVPTRIPAAPYPAREWSKPTIAIEALEAALAEGATLVDVRSAERFEGRGEPFDPPGGHIPGARSVPLTENLDPSGRFRAPGELRALYEAELGGAAIEDVVVSCGSGITACHTLLALEHAGLDGARLYVGSYSEWSRSGRPTERS